MTGNTLWRYKNLDKMLIFANAAASFITTRKGALRMMPDRGEVKESVDLCKKEIYYEIKRDFCKYMQLIFIKKSAKIPVKIFL